MNGRQCDSVLDFIYLVVLSYDANRFGKMKRKEKKRKGQVGYFGDVVDNITNHGLLRALSEIFLSLSLLKRMLESVVVCERSTTIFCFSRTCLCMSRTIHLA